MAAATTATLIYLVEHKRQQIEQQLDKTGPPDVEEERLVGRPTKLNWETPNVVVVVVVVGSNSTELDNDDVVVHAGRATATGRKRTARRAATPAAPRGGAPTSARNRLGRPASRQVKRRGD